MERQAEPEPIDPPDPLAGRAGYMAPMLQDLSDAELMDHIRHWTVKRARYQARSDGRGSFWCSRVVSGGKNEALRRGFTWEEIDGPPAPLEPMPWD